MKKGEKNPQMLAWPVVVSITFPFIQQEREETTLSV